MDKSFVGEIHHTSHHVATEAGSVTLPLCSWRPANRPSSHLFQGVLESEAAVECESVSLKTILYLEDKSCTMRQLLT